MGSDLGRLGVNASAGFGVILVDPPWRYSNRGLNGASDKHYESLTMWQLLCLRPRDLAAPDSVLLLWSTWPMLSDAQALMVGWGFDYVSGFPWVKLSRPIIENPDGEPVLRPKYGTGWWARGCSEVVLIGRRGRPEIKTSNYLGLISEAFTHSRKPEGIYEYAEAMNGPYLEIFARQRREGWSCWGNEVDSDVVMPGLDQLERSFNRKYKEAERV